MLFKVSAPPSYSTSKAIYYPINYTVSDLYEPFITFDKCRIIPIDSTEIYVEMINNNEVEIWNKKIIYKKNKITRQHMRRINNRKLSII